MATVAGLGARFFLSIASRRWIVIFRQLFDSHVGHVYYLLASRRSGEALILDPVLEKVDRYLQIIRELDLRLVKAVDTAPPH
jgi:hypothetical protein